LEKKSWARPALFMMIVGAIAGFYLLGGQHYLSLSYIQENLLRVREALKESPVLVTSAFVGLYLFMTSLSIPGSIVLTLLSGAIFGLVMGTFWVMLSTTLGACIAFLMSRYLFRDYFRKKFQRQFQRMNQRVKAEGIPYLFTLRMIPVSPYVVINVVMGLTDMKLFHFAWVTCLGMLPGTFVYILAGKKLASIHSVGEILSWEIVLALCVLGLLPPVVRYATKHHTRRFAHE
jgi:uncharacterized membrane protein YdjX (TVP38/TMEM64 family)